MRTRTAMAILAGILFVTLMGYSPQSYAEVSVNIGIGVPLPRVVVPAPPPVVVIPGTYAYFAPDVGVDIFFYHGYWYRPHRGQWYRATGYNGPWDNIRGSRVPHVLRDLPPDFRHHIRDHERIRHADLNRNWKAWEQKKHWDRHEARGGHDRGKWENSRSAVNYRHEVRDVRDGRKLESNHGPIDNRHQVREARDGRKPENIQSVPVEVGGYGH